ncbi:MAG TPA: tRNA lysidine(34) synthetase TilS, partial [Candidatus Sulfotelmatobacter sp.]|nr:tRNA lysidine(34) synthetase TilS [Candidatus Sulfotelmatobacter sp.]
WCNRLTQRQPPPVVRFYMFLSRRALSVFRERQFDFSFNFRQSPGSRGGCRSVGYHGPVQSLPQRVLSHIRRQELLRAGDRVGVAVSGGIDSVALLRLLLDLKNELGIVLSVVHFNHKLRAAESDADQEFVARLACEYELEFHVDSEDVAQNAAEERVSVETAARESRYAFFRRLLGDAVDPQGLKPRLGAGPDGTAEAVPFHETPDGASKSRALAKLSNLGSGSDSAVAFLDKIVTGHTLDDQAETVLMRIIRGAGLRGLGGIHPRICVEDDDGVLCGEIVRPLLDIRRSELEQYLQNLRQPWREDSTNADARFTRNRVRKLVVPLLEQQFNPAVAENLAELAEIARGEEDYWENEISGWMGTSVHWSQPAWALAATQTPGLVQIALGGAQSRESDFRSKIDQAPCLVLNASVSRMWFLAEPVAVQRRLVKSIGENARLPLEFKHVEEILRFAAQDDASGKELSLPLGWKLILEPEELIFLTPDLREPTAPHDYEYELKIPGQVAVYEAGSSISAQRVPADAQPRYNPDHLLDAESLPGPLRVRNWRPGDRFWPAHTKSPKKIKELLQESHVAPAERKCWPLVVSGDEIVWLRGLLASASFRPKAGRVAILIAEVPLTGREVLEV